MISSSTSGREYTPSVMNKFNQLGTMASNTSNKISEQGKKITNGFKEPSFRYLAIIGLSKNYCFHSYFTKKYVSLL